MTYLSQDQNVFWIDYSTIDPARGDTHPVILDQRKFAAIWKDNPAPVSALFQKRDETFVVIRGNRCERNHSPPLSHSPPSIDLHHVIHVSV